MEAVTTPSKEGTEEVTRGCKRERNRPKETRSGQRQWRDKSQGRQQRSHGCLRQITAENRERQNPLQEGGSDFLPGSSGTGRLGDSGGPSLSVFSSVEPAYGSSPFSPWPAGCFCSFCSATLGKPRGVGEEYADQIPSTQGQGPPAPTLPSQLIISVPRIFRPIVLSFCEWKLSQCEASALSSGKAGNPPAQPHAGIPNPNLNCSPDPVIGVPKLLLPQSN